MGSPRELEDMLRVLATVPSDEIRERLCVPESKRCRLIAKAPD